MSSRNIKKTASSQAKDLNVSDLMNYKYLLISKEGIKEIETIFSKKN